MYILNQERLHLKQKGIAVNITQNKCIIDGCLNKHMLIHGLNFRWLKLLS